MKLELYHIEAALRPQFVFGKAPGGGQGDATSRFATNEEWNLKSRTIAMSVFIGVSMMFGFTLDDLKDYMDIGSHDVDDQWRTFQERMAKMRDRLALEVEAPKDKDGEPKDDLVQLAYSKAKLVRTAIRLKYNRGGWVDPLTYLNF